MNLSYRLGRVAGIDLYVHATFLLLLAFVGLSQGGIEAVLLVSAVFGCVLLHELGHALTARSFGIGTEDITLYPIGGVARLQRMPRAPGAELLITLAGPAVNLAIAGVIAVFLWVSGGALVDGFGTLGILGWDFASALMSINLVLAAFNMIPAFPMDGGRILRASLSGWLGRLRATEIAAGLGRILAVGFGVYNLMPGRFDLLRVALSVFVYMAASSELGRVRAEEWQRNYYRPSGRENSSDTARFPGDGGVWTAPPGYRWVSQGQGVWRLAPITVSSYTNPGPRSWR